MTSDSNMFEPRSENAAAFMLDLAKGLIKKLVLADSPHFCSQWLCRGLS